jgi:RNA polymerase sigma factor (sigma-70 family)
LTAPEPSPARSTDDSDRSQFWIERITKSIGGGASPRSQEAWARLEARYRRRLLLHAERLLGPKLRGEIDPEDVVNEAWGRAYKDYRNFVYRGPLSFLHWLKLQVWRVVGDHVRKYNRGDGPPATKNGSDGKTGASDDPPMQEAGPLSRAARAEIRALLEETLSGLPTLYRGVLRDFYLDEKSREEIALAHNRLPNTVTHQLKRGLVLWKKAIEEKFGGGSFESWFGRR